MPEATSRAIDLPEAGAQLCRPSLAVPSPGLLPCLVSLSASSHAPPRPSPALPSPCPPPPGVGDRGELEVGWEAGGVWRC